MSVNISDIHGMVVPIITPLTQEESLDEEAFEKIIDFQITEGIHGIFANSTTGEGVCLTDSTRRQSLKILVEKVRGRVPVYAGVSDTSSRRAILNIKEAEDLGVDIIVAHPPYYYAPNAHEEVYAYFQEIIKASSKPVMLYNIPWTTKTSISLETIKRLIEFEALIGIKDSSADFVYLQNLIVLKRNLRPEFKIFIGKSQMWTAGILSGADGGLDGISNVIPKRCVALYDKIRNGSNNIFELQMEINEIWRIYECRSFLGGIKAAMSLMGFCRPFTTQPVLMATQEEIARIRDILTKYGILKT
jgi:dihydrodipicolinate synthase/N-acetylneuraminate lyase